VERISFGPISPFASLHRNERDGIHPDPSASSGVNAQPASHSSKSDGWVEGSTRTGFGRRVMNQIEIKKLFNKARRILKHPGLDLLVSPTSESQGRLIIITPAKIGTAVQRNTIRRRIKALFYEQKLDKKGFDSVVIVKKAGVTLTYAQLKEMFVNAITQTHI
jgi:ribonuclease P protein component